MFCAAFLNGDDLWPVADHLELFWCQHLISGLSCLLPLGSEQQLQDYLLALPEIIEGWDINSLIEATIIVFHQVH